MTNTLGNIIDLIDADLKAPIIVQKNESLNISGQFIDMAGDPILLAGLDSFVATIYNEEDSTLINSALENDVLNVGRGTVDVNGNFVIRLDGDDTGIVNATLSQGEVENHILRLKWAWNDGVKDRTAIQEIRHRVQVIDIIT